MESNNYSFIELLMVRGLMLTSSCREIAELLNKGVEQIELLVSEIGPPAAVRPAKQKKDIVVKQKEPRLKEKQKQPDLKEQQKRNRDERQFIERQRTNKSRVRIYETKPVDYSKLITVMINRTTAIYVKSGADIEAEKKNYLAKIEAQKKAIELKDKKPTKKVSNWK